MLDTQDGMCWLGNNNENYLIVSSYYHGSGYVLHWVIGFI